MSSPSSSTPPPTLRRSAGSYSATKQALIEASAEVLLPVQTEKLETTAPYLVADAEALDIVAVEADSDAKVQRSLKRKGIEIVVTK